MKNPTQLTKAERLKATRKRYYDKHRERILAKNRAARARKKAQQTQVTLADQNNFGLKGYDFRHTRMVEEPATVDDALPIQGSTVTLIDRLSQSAAKVVREQNRQADRLLVGALGLLAFVAGLFLGRRS